MPELLETQSGFATETGKRETNEDFVAFYLGTDQERAIYGSTAIIADGGMGGFLLAWILGQSKQLTGGFGIGFFIFTVLSILSLYGINRVKTRWRTTWGAGEVTRARV